MNRDQARHLQQEAIAQMLAAERAKVAELLAALKDLRDNLSRRGWAASTDARTHDAYIKLESVIRHASDGAEVKPW